jgi:hypothetical protein
MFIVRTITVKPANVSWFHRDPGSTAETVSQFMAQQLSAGAFLKNRSRKVGKNKVINTMVFADQAAYEAWKTAADAHPAYIQRTEYNESNGISKVVKKFLRVE